MQRAPRFQMSRNIVALMLREMATTYGKSAGGYAWAILDPVLGVALLAVLFSLAFHRPPIGDNFVLFYASGYIPFSIFNGLTHKISKSVSFSKPFMAYPRVTFVDCILARLCLNSLTDALVLIIVFSGIYSIFDIEFLGNIAIISGAFMLVVLLALSVGCLNCFIMTAFPVYERIWSIATRPLFLVSGIFFTFDSMPESAKDFLWFNPLIHIVGLFRVGIYPTYEGSYIQPFYVIIVAGSCLLIGLSLLAKYFKVLTEA